MRYCASVDRSDVDACYFRRARVCEEQHMPTVRQERWEAMIRLSLRGLRDFNRLSTRSRHSEQSVAYFVASEQNETLATPCAAARLLHRTDRQRWSAADGNLHKSTRGEIRDESAVGRPEGKPRIFSPWERPRRQRVNGT